jgi:hypothetical protein
MRTLWYEPVFKAWGENSMHSVPRDQARILEELAKFGQFSGSVGILFGYPLLGAETYMASLVAQRYWVDPDDRMWRMFDMACIQGLFWTHLSAVWGTPDLYIYMITQGAMSILTGLRWWYNDIPWLSAYFHCHVQMFMNILLLYVYASGLHRSLP